MRQPCTSKLHRRAHGNILGDAGRRGRRPLPCPTTDLERERMDVFRRDQVFPARPGTPAVPSAKPHLGTIDVDNPLAAVPQFARMLARHKLVDRVGRDGEGEWAGGAHREAASVRRLKADG